MCTEWCALLREVVFSLYLLNSFTAGRAASPYELWTHPLHSFLYQFSCFWFLSLLFHFFVWFFSSAYEHVQVLQGFVRSLESMLINCSFLKCFFFWLLQGNLYIAHPLLTNRHTLQNTLLVLLICGVFPTSLPGLYVQDRVTPFLSPTPTYN